MDYAAKLGNMDEYFVTMYAVEIIYIYLNIFVTMYAVIYNFISL
jgi:hypothetical protein